jgi:hypothetical protein
VTEPSCRSLRELLGVYVVGAIEPAERSMVDSHLETCLDCREELAGLAALPALLHRVSVPDAERIAGRHDRRVSDIEPSEQMLNALMRQVRARRGAQRVRRLFGLAAAVIIAAGSSVAVTRALVPGRSAPVASASFERAFGTNGSLNGWVRYRNAPWGGTTMSVRVTGLMEWTNCKFWVLTTSGQMVRAGGWTVGPGSDHIWYPVSVPVPKAQVAAFLITAAHQTLQIPAT